MIRQPTSRLAALRWWRQAIADPSTPRHDGEPQAGFYRMRKVKGGPFLPVEIRIASVTDDEGELTEPETIEAEVNGWPEDAERIWTYCTPISRAEFMALQERHRTLDVMASDEAIDLSETPILPGA